MPARRPDAHKGECGRVLVAGGSLGMSGAAILCGLAALRSGAGLVRLAVPRTVLPLVAPAHPCLMTTPLPEDDGRLTLPSLPGLLEAVDWADVLALGPGLGRSHQLDELVPQLLAQTTKPVVVDADALNALAENPDRLLAHGGPLVLTPHPGEFARLLGADTAAVQADRTGLARNFAARYGVVLVLKGRGTVVTDGKRVSVNTTGNPGMATGGSGDVLTGILAALIGQGLELYEAARLGAHVHGLAGDLAREHHGETSLIATDLLDHLSGAFKSLAGSAQQIKS